MSSAILFLAIVAIWACVLVPRWLHRSHEATAEVELVSYQEEAPDHAEAPGHEEFRSPGESGPEVTAYPDPALADAAFRAEPAAPADEPARVDPGWAERAAEADPGRNGGVAHAGPTLTGSTGHVSAYAYSYSSVRSDFTTTRSAFAPQSGADSDPGRPAAHLPRPPRPHVRRARVLQARRRMLTMLVALALVAMGCALLGLTRWWTAVPPVGMLGFYLSLLREAAHADGAEARRQDEAHARAQAARAAHERARLAHESARQAREAQPLPATAEVIDISGRTAPVGDQLYDQYADAAIRAVGD